jgi:hypothetical protein
MPNITRPEIDTFSIPWREIFQQFDFVTTGSFQNRELNLGADDSGDFPSQFASLMCGVRKLEAKKISPESERPFQV